MPDALPEIDRCDSRCLQGDVLLMHDVISIWTRCQGNARTQHDASLW